MTSILKTDEIQSQNGGSVVKMQTLKHPSSSGNNITLDGSNNVSLGGTLSAGTIGGSVGRASGYPFAQYEILEGFIPTSWVQITLSDSSSGVKYEYGGIDLANSNNDITVPSTGMYEIRFNWYNRDNSSIPYLYFKCNKHTANIAGEGNGTPIWFNGYNSSDIGGSSNTHSVMNATFFYSLSANDHLSFFGEAQTASDQQENPVTDTDTVLKSYVSVRKIFDL